MLSDEYPAFNQAPSTLGGTTVKFYTFMTDDVDADCRSCHQSRRRGRLYGSSPPSVVDPCREWTLSQRRKR